MTYTKGEIGGYFFVLKETQKTSSSMIATLQCNYMTMPRASIIWVNLCL